MRRRMAILVSLALLVAAVGCIGAEDGRSPAPREEPSPFLVVLAMEPVQGVYASDPDRSGDEIERNDQLVRNGTTELWFQANWSEESTGIQLGYALDGGETTWLETREPGEITKLEIDPDQCETDERRWTFYWRPASEAGPGASFGSNANVLVKAFVEPNATAR